MNQLYRDINYLIKRYEIYIKSRDKSSNEEDKSMDDIAFIADCDKELGDKNSKYKYFGKIFKGLDKVYINGSLKEFIISSTINDNQSIPVENMMFAYESSNKYKILAVYSRSFNRESDTIDGLIINVKSNTFNHTIKINSMDIYVDGSDLPNAISDLIDGIFSKI